MAIQLDGLQYIASNPDLIVALGANAAAGQAHYVAFGQAEGPTDTFDEQEYLARNPDLQAVFGNDGNAATLHYIQHGWREGRVDGPPDGLSRGFDSLQYIASNPDLAAAFGANIAAGEAHYLSLGAAEGRQSDTFEEQQYLARYSDLAAAFGTDGKAATIHYIQHGMAEGRSDGAQTARSAPVTLPDSQSVALSVVTEDRTTDGTTELSGVISLTGFLSNNYNIVVINDASGSTGSLARDGDGNYLDLDGDGQPDSIFEADVAAFNELATQLRAAGLGDADLGIVSFGSDATLDAATTIGNAAEIDAALNNPGSGGSTDYEAALQSAIAYFNGQSDVGTATNVVYFLSDGFPNGPDYSDEYVALTNPAGIGAIVNAFGAGTGVSEDRLDEVDNTGGSEIFTDLSQIAAGLSGSSLDPSDITSVAISVNGTVQQTFDGSVFTDTPTGLRFGPVQLTGLDPAIVNSVAVNAVVTASDGSTFNLDLAASIPGSGAGPAASDLIF
jgi:hypothetical protein